jgi:hypothetical protein
MENYADRYKQLTINYAESFALLAIVGLIAYFSKDYLPLAGNKWFMLIAVFLPSWATLSTVIWGIQSFEGKTPPENLNKWVLRISYMAGFALYILTS